MLPNIPRLFTAVAEWMACAAVMQALKPRFEGMKKVIVYVGMLIMQSFFLCITENAKGVLWGLCMVIAASIMVSFIYTAAETDWIGAVYYAAISFMLAEFTASLEWQIYCYVDYMDRAESILLKYLMMAGIYLPIFFVSEKVILHFQPAGEDMKITWRELYFMFLIVLSFFVMSNAGFAGLKTPFSATYSMDLFNVRTLVDLGGLGIICAYHLQWTDDRIRKEYSAIHNILNNQYVQFEQSQETLELIHYKYHDLKHHIHALRAENDTRKREILLDQMEDEIRFYDAKNRTGNKTLDVLLTTKAMNCQKNDISFTCVADGKLFEFMDVMDICSIFGNALDNAIECEKKISDPEKRMIHVSAFSKKQFLIIRFENYYEGTLEFEQNLPVTTKKRAEFHGYGLKSLQYTVHKYNGEVDISTENNWFYLKILIPV